MRNAGPAILLVVFGGVFALLGLLTLSIVLTSIVDQDERIVANAVPLVAAALLFAAGAWVFGTALRLPFLPHPLGEPALALVPAEGSAGGPMSLEISLAPVRHVVVEGVEAELRCVEIELQGATVRRRILHEETIVLPMEPAALAPGAREKTSLAFAVPQNAAPSRARDGRNRAWTLAVRIRVRAAPDWTGELPLTIR